MTYHTNAAHSGYLRAIRYSLGAILVHTLAMAPFAWSQTDYYFRHPDLTQPPTTAEPAPNGDWFLDTNGDDPGQSYWWNPTGNPGFQNYIPDYTFSNGEGERARIENGGTAYVQSLGSVAPGDVWIGYGGGTTGRVEIRSGGTLEVRAGSVAAGGIAVGNTGTGSLEVFSGGTLTAEGPISVANGSTVSVNPGGNFSNQSTLSFSGSSTYQVDVSGNQTSGTINVGTTATLGGNLEMNFTYTPTLAHSWTILEANAINGSFDSISSNLALADNQQLILSRPDLGGGRFGLRASIEELLVLEVNRDNGMATIKNLASSAVPFDGYYVGSNGGLLSDQDADWNSLNEGGQFGADWVETAQTVNNIGELKVGADANLAGESDISLGTIYNPLAGDFGSEADDLEFAYRRSDGTQVPGIVKYIGTRTNNLLLQVDPLGVADTYLRNPSNTTVEIDGYEILSADGSLSTSGWSSLNDQAATPNTWLEALNNSANQLAEFDSEGFTTLAPGAAINLGKLFSGGTQDLEFNFLMMGSATGTAGAVVYQVYTPSEGLPGDFNNDSTVNIADYVFWRNNLGAPESVLAAGSSADANNIVDAGDYATWKSNFGQTAPGALAAAAAVPEPTSWLLLGLAAGLALVRRDSK